MALPPITLVRTSPAAYSFCCTHYTASGPASCTGKMPRAHGVGVADQLQGVDGGQPFYQAAVLVFVLIEGDEAVSRPGLCPAAGNRGRRSHASANGPQALGVDVRAILPELFESSADADDFAVGPYMIGAQLQPRRLGGGQESVGLGILAHQLGPQLRTRRKGSGCAGLLSKTRELLPLWSDQRRPGRGWASHCRR